MKSLLFLTIACLPFLLWAQPDSTRIDQRNRIFLYSGTAATYGLSVIAMNELWYKNYKRSAFHWINDSKEWLQVDKTGHFFFSYVGSRAFSGKLESTGLSREKSVLVSSGIALLGVSTVEVFDGFSAGWGASVSDLIANTSGVALFASQSLLWGEEKIIPKMSWHSTSYAAFRPDVLGKSLAERMLKDYNGHTLWFSFNLKSITRQEFLPPWLCFSLGYGAEGMISGYDTPEIMPHFDRYRQYYLSFDADLSRIQTRSKTINFILHRLNIFKVPFPAIVFSNKGTEIRPLYF